MRGLAFIAALCLAPSAVAQTFTQVTSSDYHPFLHAAGGKTPMVVFQGAIHYIGRPAGQSIYAFMRYDGTGPATKVADIDGYPPNYNPELVVHAGAVYFPFRSPATPVDSGVELWVYDGVNPPSMVADSVPGAGDLAPKNLVSFAGNLFFQGNKAAGTAGLRMWRYDGTGPPAEYAAPGGPSPSFFHVPIVVGASLYYKADQVLVRMDAGGSVTPLTGVGTIVGTTAFAGDVYALAAGEPSTPGYELYQVEGPTPTVPALESVPDDAGTSMRAFTELAGRLYFTTTGAPVADSIYAWDGVNPPTVLPNIAVHHINWPGVVVDGELYWYDPPYLYRSRDTEMVEVFGQFAGPGVEFLGATYFVGDDGSGDQLWRMDAPGTCGPTRTCDPATDPVVIYAPVTLPGGGTGTIRCQRLAGAVTCDTEADGTLAVSEIPWCAGGTP